jgi:hypothetical protein
MSRIWVSVSVVIAGGWASVTAAAAAETDAAQKSAFEAALTEADRRFVEGDVQGALEVLEPACARSESAECSFSLGAIHHGLGHCSEALAYYRHYRAVSPRGEHVGEVTAALEEVESRCGDADIPAPAAAPPAPQADAALTPASTAGSASGPGTAEPPVTLSPTASANTELVVGSFAISGAAAVSSVVFGILAARSARHCGRARSYDRRYVQECEVEGPRYQGLWQGFAFASGGFLGVGLTLWWLDERSSGSLGVSGAGYPELTYRRSF